MSSRYLQNLYNSLSTLGDRVSKFSVLYQIIEFKGMNESERNVSNSLYIDIKTFLDLYLRDDIALDVGYDMIEASKICYVIEVEGTTSTERFNLYQFASRKLSNSSYEDLAELCKSKAKKNYTLKLWNERYTFGKYLKLLLHISSYSLSSVFLSSFVLFVIISILLLPIDSGLTVVRIEYDNYSCNRFFNHCLNVAGYLFGITSGFKAIAINGFGVVLLVLIRISIFLLIGNYLHNRIIEKIHK